MRLCPFCSAENADELAVCQACGRRLPPLPPRRTRNAPPTGVQLPPRPAGSSLPPPIPPGARKSGTTVPPPIAAATPPTDLARPATEPPAELLPVMPAGASPNQTLTAAAPPPPVPRESAPVLPPPPVVDERSETMGGGGPAGYAGGAGGNAPRGIDEGRRQLLDAIAPGPAAERREPPPAEDRIIADRRRRDSKAPPLSPGAFARPATASQPPPIAEARPSSPPPIAEVRPSSPPPPIVEARPSSPPPVVFSRPGSGFEHDTSPMAPLVVEPDVSPRKTPPPTRINRSETLVDRPFTPPKVLAVPEIPEPGLVHAAKYTYQFAVAFWQRGGAIKQLGIEIKQDTEALDQVLGALGRAARGARIEGRVFSAENAAINAAEERIGQLGQEVSEVEARKAEENSKFVDIERERNEKLAEAERMVEEAQRELSQLEAQRRGLRDKRKELERRQKAYLKAAEDHDRQSAATPMGDQRQELRRVAEGHRREAATLEPERQDIDRRLGAVERPIGEVTAKLDAAKAELDAAKRSLNDAREGHTHRLAELDSEQKRKQREVSLGDSEIARRLVTLGTLVNLNRIEDPQFAELYERIDRLRGAITARTTEIEKLTAEREAYDRGTLIRGVATVGGAFVALIALIVILRAIL